MDNQSIAPQVTEQKPSGSAYLRWLPLAVVVVVFAFAFYALKNQKQDLPNSVLLGRVAPSFELPLIQGEGDLIRLADLQATGKITVINFWASWCTVCQQEAADLEVFWQENRQNINLLGIAIQDSQKEALQFAEKFGMTYPLAIDTQGEVAINYGMLGVPETYIVDHNGTLRERIIGVVTKERLQTVVEQISN